jgi:hypothetical protein
VRRVRTPKPPRARRLGVVIFDDNLRCRAETYLGFDTNSEVGISTGWILKIDRPHGRKGQRNHP